MPNHVHLLIDTSIQLVKNNDKSEVNEKNYTQLFDILKMIKGASAFEANKLLGRKGKFWQKESYDHIVLDENELVNTIEYIIQNPVKAGLVDDWENWKYSFVNADYL